VSYRRPLDPPQWPYGPTEAIPNVMPFFGRLFEVNTQGPKDPRVLVAEGGDSFVPSERPNPPVVCDIPGRELGALLVNLSPAQIESAARRNWPCGTVTWMAREGNVVVGGGLLDRTALAPSLHHELTSGLFVPITVMAALNDPDEVTKGVFANWSVQGFKIGSESVWPGCGIRSALAVVSCGSDPHGSWDD
jgi:hypothetical protein